jgi:hypothetical protein
MEEKELVPAKSVHDDLLEAFRGAAHTNDLSVLKLSEMPHDSLVPALNYIMNVMKTIQQKHSKLKELSVSAERLRADLENRIKSLEESIAKQEEALKNKQEEAEAVKSKFPLWVTLLCWFLAMFQIWPGIIAYFCFRSHYRKNPTEQGLQAQTKLIQEADDMKQKLEKQKQDLKNLKASFKSSVEKQKKAAASEFNRLASSLKEYIQSPEVDWALNALSEEYMDYSAIENFIKYLQAGRADNLKEAINLYEEELHRGRVENIQRATLETTRATLETTTAAAEYSALAAKHAERTARAAEESAVSLDEIQKLLRKGQKK